MARVQLKPRAEPAREAIRCIPSGSTLLDLVLGGGWAEGRVANIVGDKSAGKTLLAIEACANFALRYRAEDIAYREAEAAFDMPYAQSMGMPSSIDWNDEIRTIEAVDADLVEWLADHENSLYALDSLDSLSSDDEMARKTGEATYGTEKAKALSEMFRKRIGDIRKRNCTTLIISQIRDNIGVTFGETKKRSGGRALDFYASQVIWLAEIKKIKRTVTGVDRIVGVEVLARNKKNKIGKPFRHAEFSILFNYGIDDEQSMVDWLKKNKGERWLSESLADTERAFKDARAKGDRTYAAQVHEALQEAVRARWNEIEEALAPTMSKYA